jgi:non-lysosomal glucosylceramidase
MPKRWPVLSRYDSNHLLRIALPLGGIGTGTVSLGGRGDLRDWELGNRPAKGFIPRALKGGGTQSISPFFAVWARDEQGHTFTRALEGALDPVEYEGSSGSTAANHGLPRFSRCSFAAAYPLGQVYLDDPALPFSARLQAFNPLIPTDSESSGLPAAFLRYTLRNRTGQPLQAALCATLPNFIGCDPNHLDGASGNQIAFCESRHLRGLYMESTGVDPQAEAWGSLVLGLVDPPQDLSYRTNWRYQAPGSHSWGNGLLDFWDDFSADGALEECPPDGADLPVGSLCARFALPPKGAASLTFILAWHFPNRYTWTPDACDCEGNACQQNWIGNYYTTRFSDAWAAAEHAANRADALERQTVRFVRAFCDSDLPHEVREAALFNLSTLRSQTCFRTVDGRFYGWEGCNNTSGCCHGSCTHVWNYEQATAFLFGDLSRQMREIEFGQALRDDGLMSFRVNLPLEKAKNFDKAAADGQMGCIMKIYRDWQLSADDEMLRHLWPNVRKALEFCWVPGGWDADRDGVMEGCQHNTMDVEYFGPNPQMESWYLGALRAAEEMARRLGDETFAVECRRLFENGRAWTDAHLFNGEYYIHEVRPPRSRDEIAPGLMVGMGADDLSDPDFQLAQGCLVDQLVGQYMAHICGLGYLLDPAHVRTTLESIYRFNLQRGFYDHFNCMRSYVLGDETALLMASYPYQRPVRPFPYFSEAMTGFEYTAAVGMVYENLEDIGLECIANIRARYDGRKRSPFDEAECGHHYARAMAAWAAVLALSGFHYSALEQKMSFAAKDGHYFWSTGNAWGTARLTCRDSAWQVDLALLDGKLALEHVELENIGPTPFTLRKSF